MSTNLIASSSPHLRSNDTTQRIMLDVLIALVPAMLAGVITLGYRTIMVVGVTVLACVVSEYIWNRVTKKTQTVSDMSAAVTGVLLAYNLPVSIPLWIAVIGGVVAIIIVKQLFGGLGHNFMNPALAARAFMLASWPVQMTNWTSKNVDAVTGATPLALIKKGGEAAAGPLPSYMDLFLGTVGGSIGEISALALLLGAAYLFYRRVLTWEIPVSFIGTVAVLTLIFGGDGFFAGDFVYNILSGGLILGAFYMATDYTTSPMTSKGKVVMGVGCGLITAVIRMFGGYPEGVSYSILLMNIAVPLIDRYTIPVSFGGVKKHA